MKDEPLLYYRTKEQIEYRKLPVSEKFKWLAAQMEFFHKAMPDKAKKIREKLKDNDPYVSSGRLEESEAAAGHAASKSFGTSVGARSRSYRRSEGRTTRNVSRDLASSGSQGRRNTSHV